jgi:hypothetical protein
MVSRRRRRGGRRQGRLAAEGAHAGADRQGAGDAIDDAGGKAKLFSEFGNTESTGLTIASGNAIAAGKLTLVKKA